MEFPRGVVADMILFVRYYFLSVRYHRKKFSHIKFSMVSVVPILPMFVSNSTPFLLTVFFLGASM